LGTPHAVTISADGTRIVFLRSSGPDDPTDRIWVMDLPDGSEREIGATSAHPGCIEAYATDEAASVAAFTIGGRLYRADLGTGEVTALPSTGYVIDPRPDPAGRRIAYVTDGQLRVIDADGADTLMAGEGDATWGLAEFVADREFGRSRGYWWSPDGERL